MFQSTRPARGATLILDARVAAHVFQSTRPARGATTPPIALPVADSVSIHAPRAGRDESPWA